MAKQKNINELVTVKKEGVGKRQFTRQQLEAMGTDTPHGDSYDGWKIVGETKEPKEVTQAKGVSAGKGDKGVSPETVRAFYDEVYPDNVDTLESDGGPGDHFYTKDVNAKFHEWEASKTKTDKNQWDQYHSSRANLAQSK